MYSCISLSEYRTLISDYYDSQGGVIGWLTHLHFDFSIDDNPPEARSGPGAAGSVERGAGGGM